MVHIELLQASQSPMNNRRSFIVILLNHPTVRSSHMSINGPTGDNADAGLVSSKLCLR